jgi:hypothetical protein
MSGRGYAVQSTETRTGPWRPVAKHCNVWSDGLGLQPIRREPIARASGRTNTLAEKVRAVMPLSAIILSAALFATPSHAIKVPAPYVEIGPGAYLKGPITVRDEKGNIVLRLLPDGWLWTRQCAAHC